MYLYRNLYIFKINFKNKKNQLFLKIGTSENASISPN